MITLGNGIQAVPYEHVVTFYILADGQNKYPKMQIGSLQPVENPVYWWRTE